MRLADTNLSNIGLRPALIFAVLVILIIVSNGLLLWQFHIASFQMDRLNAANQQVIAALRLQGSLLSFHQRLEELDRSREPDRFVTEAEPLSKTLLEQAQRIKNDLRRLPPETPVNLDFITTLDAIEATSQSQLEAMSELARSGDWVAVRLRLASELTPLENHTSALVNSTQMEVNAELVEAFASMRSVQQRIYIFVPVSAISTFLIAAFFGWATARRMIELRMEERVDERTRIARELHDTLLQSLHGLMFEFQAARNLFARNPQKALVSLDEAISNTRRAIIESRDAIHDLRPQPVAEGDLAQLLETKGEELAAIQDTFQVSPKFRVIVEGEPRKLSRMLQDEVYKIALEVLRNAFRHADASQIEAEIRYDNNQLRLRLRDNGKGIDPKVLEDSSQPGHWGLPGVRERAQRIGSRLNFWSQTGAGTEVELVVPASIAYETSRDRFRFRLLSKAGSRG